ncbi:MAG: heavy-metal-associated domain-containing protein [Oscillospiraceae bacterium]|nr:heavy-metal-associated domain-containing protein [Oscillospiraceae bacterium]
MELKIEGMMCPHCKARVEKVLQAIPGVESVIVNLEGKTATVSGTADFDTCKKAVIEAGYQVLN